MLFYKMNIEGGTIFASLDTESVCALSSRCATTRNVLKICT